MKIRIGTFNLYQFVKPPYSWYTKKEKFNPIQWEEKTSWIKKQINKMDCDIIGLQEVFSSKALKELVQELGFNYFKTVDIANTSKKNPKVYISTTVAIASKYPITKLHTVKPNFKSLKKHDFYDTFSFSRIPIKASITLPNNQDLLVYVAHLKSNRDNEFEYVFNASHTLEDKKEQVNKALKEGFSNSLKQRLCEASSLFFNIKKTIDTPTIFLCDLNDKEFSITIDALTNEKYHDENSLEDLHLLDANNLFEKEVYNPHPEATEEERTPTSYFVGKGNVLDYIFVSKHFDKNEKEHISKVSSYEIFNEHLENNHDGSLLQSDHAQVVCELIFNEKNQ
ncbi:endonuclease/exonuclease/phosphatase family protein [Poseidonibacter sp.]|uniref:endonuclease/exonuclease/phosphatase family protein n=1 Tax=Poseidonibacter sp. TaxID=2321188 RepID=UPI003C77B5DC